MLELGTRLAEAVREQAAVPDVEIPDGRWLELPRRGRTWLTELPGPPGAPTVVLLHAVGCTGTRRGRSTQRRRTSHSRRSGRGRPDHRRSSSQRSRWRRSTRRCSR